MAEHDGWDDGGHDGGDWWDDSTGHDDGGWEEVDFCSEFDADQCEVFPFCEWTDAGCVMTEHDGWDDGGHDDGGWDGGSDELCDNFGVEECEMFPICEWTDAGCVMTDFGDDGGWNDDGGHDDGGWNDHFLECEDFGSEECNEVPFCEWTDAGCIESEYGWCDDNDWNDGDEWTGDFSFCYELDVEACEIVPFCTWDMAEDICGINQWGWGDSGDGYSFGNGEWVWSEGGFDLGDINVDSEINVIDIVKQVNFILEQELPNDFEYWASDLNIDDLINVIDVVNLVNIILDVRVDFGESKATYDGKMLTVQGNIGAIQFEGTLESAVLGNDLMATANGKTVIYNLDGIMYTSKFEISNLNSKIIVSSSAGEYVDVTTITQFSVLSNYPNPFNPSTTISYELVNGENITLSVYNMYGQFVDELVSGYVDAGIHSVVWDAADYSNGIYLVKLQMGLTSETSKITLLK